MGGSMVLKMAPLVGLTNEKLQMKNFLGHLLKDELIVLNKFGKTPLKLIGAELTSLDNL